jgi:hypothetical protein
MTSRFETKARARRRGRSCWLVLIAALLGWMTVQSSSAPANARQEPAVPPVGSLTASIPGLRELFERPPDDSRIMMRWWWFGPAVTNAGLEREMRLMKAGGIGGFEVQPVYPVVLDSAATGTRTLPFLSPEFLDALRFVSETSRQLGLRMDLTLGSGWPYGGPQIDIEQAAGKLRVERAKVASGTPRIPIPDVGAGERLIGAFLIPAGSAPVPPTPARELTAIAGGAVTVPSDAGTPADVLFFISSRSGMMVKRPAIGAEGYVLDHYDRASLDRYLDAVGERLLKVFGPTPPYAIFCDSLEVFESDWTPRLLDEFRARRGYDLRPHLPALVLDSDPTSSAVRHDWGQTLTELADERFLAPLGAWAQRHQTRLRVQAYGIPPITIGSAALVDLPEGEGAQWRSVHSARWAASAGHLYDRPVVSSETWTWLHSPAFRATPLDVKAEADVHFLQGVTQLVGHGWPYTAEGMPYPGWRFYAAAVFNEKNPWWTVMPDVSLYLQRLSFMLRQGRPVNDVALYLPNDDAWARFAPGRVGTMIEALSERVGPTVIGRILDAGFGLDFFDAGVLAGIGRVEGNTLALGSNRYRAVVLPNVERIDELALRQFEAFVRNGGVLVATGRLPALAPGFLATASDHATIVAAVDRLFHGPAAPAVFVEDDSRLAEALVSRIQPDMRLAVPLPDVGFVHRRTSFADVYFVANTSNLPVRTSAAFRAEAGRVEAWEPLSGRTSAVAARRVTGQAGVTVDVELPPYGSRLYVLVPGSAAKPPRASAQRPAAPLSVNISSAWTVSFGPGAPTSRWDRLRSWTDDDATKHFSGVATYEKVVDLAPSMLRRGWVLELDLGDAKALPAGGPRDRFQARLDPPVREAAVVFVNNQRAAAVWCPPYRLDVTAFVRPGPNTIRIEVANLAINHMAGVALPDYRLLNLRYGTRFEPQDMDKVRPIPSGLLGPVRMVASAPGPSGAVSVPRR